MQIQVGEYEGKPVFLPVRVPLGKGKEDVDDAIEKIAKAVSEGSQVSTEFKFQNCTGKKKCVKSCKDERGKLYCCRYECVSR